MSNLRLMGRNLAMTVGKGAISLAIIIFIFFHVDRGLLFSNGQKLSLHSIAALVLVLGLQTTVLAGLRLKLVLEGLGARRPLSATCQVALSGFFIEQVAFGFVGGDAMRLWLLHRFALPMKTSIAAIVIDRCTGLLALLALSMAGLPRLIALLPKADQPVIVFVIGLGLVAALAMALVAHFFSKALLVWLAMIAAWARDVVRSRRFWLCVAGTFALAFLTHVMNVYVFFLISRDLEIPLQLHDWFFIVPPALLLSTLPITAGGWGLRESSLIVALAPYGIAPEQAIIPSIIFGLGLLLVTLPGGIVWLLNRRARNDSAAKAVGMDRGPFVAELAPDEVGVAPVLGGTNFRGGRSPNR